VDEELLQSVEKDMQKRRPPADFSAGADDGRFGDWKLEQLLGRNSIGELYLAKKSGDKTTEGLAALRSFDSALSRNSRLVKRFLEEAEKAAAVVHPHIAPVIDFGRAEDGTAFLARKYIDGQTLQNILKHGLVALDRGIEVLIDVCSTLQEAEKNGLVHQNLNPSNIIIDNNGFVYVVDFGLTKSVPSEARETMGLTNFHDRSDDMRYFSPEQVRDEKLDVTADLFSLGCIMHYLFTGEEIFADRTGFRLVQAKLQRLIEKNAFDNINFAGTPEERKKKIETFMMVVQRAVSGDRQWRYGSAQELSEDLNRLRAGKDLQPATINAVKDISKACVFSDSDPIDAAEGKSGSRWLGFLDRNLSEFAIAASVIFLLIGLYYFFHH
jgi:serine/threonine protein kinase